MKINWLLVILVIGLAVSTVLLGKIIWQERQLKSANSQLNKELMKANLEIGRAHTEFGNAMKYANMLEDELDKEIKERNARITRYGELEALYTNLESKKDKVKIIFKEGEPNLIPIHTDCLAGLDTGLLYFKHPSNQLGVIQEFPLDYKDHRLYLKILVRPIKENNPIGIAFERNIKYLLNLKIAGQTVETITPSGAINHYLNLWEIDDKGEKIKDIELTRFEMIVDDKRTPRFYWWAPQVDISALFTLSLEPKFTMGGSIGFSFLGYGLDTKHLYWRFARISLDFTDTLGFGLSPFTYNLGQHIPIIQNFYLGPHVNWSINNQWWLGISIGTIF